MIKKLNTINYTITAFFLIIFFNVYASEKVKNKKILFVVHTFPRLTETFILSQMKAFINAGYELSILSRTKDELALMHQDIVDYNLLMNTTYIDYYDKKNAAIVGIKMCEYDIVYCQYDRIGCVFADLKEKNDFNGKLVVCVRGWPRKGNRMEDNPIEYARLFQQVDLILPVCHFFRNEFIKYGCPPEKIIVHHSAIDCDAIAYKKRDDSKKKVIDILTTARLINSKGLDKGINAIAHLIHKYSNIRYTIIGGGKLYESLKSLIGQYDMREKILLLGWQPHDIVKKALYNADMYVHPSMACEGIPNAIMEAMASGLPVVSTDVNGTPELVRNNQTGIVVESGSIDKLAEGIERLIRDKKLRNLMGLKGRHYVEQEHNIVLENEKLLKLFEELM